MERKKSFAFNCLGTKIQIQLIAENEQQFLQCEKHFEKIQQLYTQAMKIFSRFDSQSELSKLNASLVKWHVGCKWMNIVAQRTIEYYENTHGFFDPRVIDVLEATGYNKDFKEIVTKKTVGKKIPTKWGDLREDLLLKQKNIMFKRRMDFSGIVKGFVTDETAKYLKSQGYKNFLIDSGGDIYAAGHDANEQYWYVAIEGITEKKMMLKLSNQAIATSGISRRKWEMNDKRVHHLVNPKNPEKFSFDLKSVTVLAASVEMADVWAKVFFLAGVEKAAQIAVQNNLEYLFFYYNNQIRISQSFEGYIYK